MRKTIAASALTALTILIGAGAPAEARSKVQVADQPAATDFSSAYRYYGYRRPYRAYYRRAYFARPYYSRSYYRPWAYSYPYYSSPYYSYAGYYPRPYYRPFFRPFGVGFGFPFFGLGLGVW